MSTIAMPAVTLVQMADADRFVPVVWASHREDGVDPQHPVPVSDWNEPYLAKWDGPALTHPLDDDFWQLPALPVTDVLPPLAVPGGVGPSHGILTPVTLPGGGLIGCCAAGLPGVVTPDPIIPQPAPIPLAGSALFLAAAIIALPLIRLMRRARP